MTESKRSIGVGDYADLLNMVESIIYSIIPDGDDYYEVTGDENLERLEVRVEFTDEKYIGLFCGYRRLNVEMLLQFIRAQQVYPHDRYIVLKVIKPDGQVQTFVNAECAKLRGKSKSNLLKLAIQQRTIMEATDVEDLFKEAFELDRKRLQEKENK